MIKSRVQRGLLLAALTGACAAPGCRFALTERLNLADHPPDIDESVTTAEVTVPADDSGPTPETTADIRSLEFHNPPAWVLELQARRARGEVGDRTADFREEGEAESPEARTVGYEEDNPFLLFEEASQGRSETRENAAPSSPPELSPADILVQLGALIERGADGSPVAVELSLVPLRDEDLSLLAKLGGLKQLDLNNTPITDAGLSQLSGLSELQLLGLRGTGITDRGLVHIAPLQKLRYLLLCQTSITDSGLAHLRGLTSLEGLSLIDCPVTHAGVAALQQQLPDCRILLESPADLETADPRGDEADVDRPSPFEPVAPFGLPESVELLDEPAEPSSSPNPFLEVPAEPELEPPGPTFHPEQLAPEPAPPADPPKSKSRSRLRKWLPLPRRLRDELGLPTSKTLPAGAEVGDAQAAQPEAVRAVLRDPQMLREAGLMYAARENWTNAAILLQRAQALQPGDPHLEYELGVALARSGRLEDALPHLIASVGPAAGNYNAGILAYEQGRLLESRGYLREALRLAPDLHEARYWLTRLDAAQDASPRVTVMPPQSNDEQVLELIDAVLVDQQRD